MFSKLYELWYEEKKNCLGVWKMVSAWFMIVDQNDWEKKNWSRMSCDMALWYQSVLNSAHYIFHRFSIGNIFLVRLSFSKCHSVYCFTLHWTTSNFIVCCEYMSVFCFVNRRFSINDNVPIGFCILPPCNIKSHTHIRMHLRQKRSFFMNKIPTGKIRNLYISLP